MTYINDSLSRLRDVERSGKFESVKFTTHLIQLSGSVQRNLKFSQEIWKIDGSDPIASAGEEYRSAGPPVSLLTQLIARPRPKCKSCHRSKWNRSTKVAPDRINPIRKGELSFFSLSPYRYVDSPETEAKDFIGSKMEFDEKKQKKKKFQPLVFFKRRSKRTAGTNYF